MDFYSKKRLYAAVLKMNQIKSRQRQANRTALSKGKELSAVSSSWNSIQESFEKGTFSKALYGQLFEKKSKAIANLSEDLFLLERVQKVLNRQLDEVIKGNPEMIPLMMFDRVSFEEKSGFRKSRILKGSDAWILDGRTQYADVIVINKNNEILFTVRNRADDFEPGKYCLPGGHVDEGENAAEAARRELQEETGIEIPIEEFAPCGEYFDDKAHINYFCVSYDGDPLVLEFREQEQYEWVSIDEIRNKPLIMNLADNFAEIIEVPKSKINPIASSAEKYYLDGNLIEDQADKDFQALLDITREKLIKGEISLQEYIDIRKFGSVVDTLFIKGEDYKWNSRIEKARQGLVAKKVQVTRNGKTFTTTKWVKPETSKVKEDRSGNLIGDGSYHTPHHIEEFPEKYGEIYVNVSKSETTESVYVTYTSAKTHKSITCRFSNHENNAVKFGDQLNGQVASRDEILARLGLKKAIFVPKKSLSIATQQIAKKKLQNYEEADLTIKEMYALGAGADLSSYKGKRAKGSNYLILGDKVHEYEETRSDMFGTHKIGSYVYEDFEDDTTTLLDDSGHSFVEDENGSIDFGWIPSGIGVPEGPIRLSDVPENPEGGDYGINHIERRHGEEIRKKGFSDVKSFVSYVCKNWDSIRQGKKDSCILLSPYSKKYQSTLYISLEKSGKYWKVISGGVFKGNNLKKKKEIYSENPAPET